jgi:DNA-binding NarL/FixJ family response regulator
MRVLVADNDPRVRAAINMFFKCEPELSIVGESTNASSFLAQAKALRPDLVLIDWELPGSSVTVLIEWLKEAEKPAKIIVLSKRPEREQEALAVGADAFISKTRPADSLIDTLQKLFQTPDDGSIFVDR